MADNEELHDSQGESNAVQKILVADDEASIRRILETRLKMVGYDVVVAEDGEEAVEVFNKTNPDLVVLDVMMPKMDDYGVTREIRRTSDVPIIILTALGDVSERITGLELGADDYVTKPFSIRELIARIKANLRKAEITIDNKNENSTIAKDRKKENIIEVGPLLLDIERFEVYVNGKNVDLTLREFEVLKFLATEPGQVISREELLEKVWGYEYYGDIRTVDVTVRRIREKIEKDTSNPKILMTKRSVGYYIAN